MEFLLVVLVVISRIKVRSLVFMEECVGFKVVLYSRKRVLVFNLEGEEKN